jgi:hypothetical protein
MKSHLRSRTLVLLALGVIALAAGYIVGANAYLRSGNLERHLNGHPDHFMIRWASARTIWPGVVQIKGLELRGQSRTTQWWFHIDETTATINLLRLVRRELAVASLNGTGIAVRLRRRPEQGSDGGPPQQTPPIPGLLNTTAPPESAEANRLHAPSWRILISDATLEHMREVSIHDCRFVGEARAQGGFDLHLDRRFELEPATATFRAGTVSLASRPLLDSATGSIRFELPPLDPGHIVGGFLRLASGSVNLEGRLDGLSFLDPSLSQLPWLKLTASPGAIQAKVLVRQGKYLAGTHVAIHTGQVNARLLDDEASGRGTVNWDVSRDGSSNKGNLVVAFDEFTLLRPGAQTPRGHGRGLHVEIATRDPDVATLPSPTALSIDLPPTELGDFSSYNRYLPARTGIALRSGTGLWTANLRAAAPSWEATGATDLRGDRVVADIQATRLQGNFRMRSRFRALPKQRELTLTESDVQVSDVIALGSAAGPGWWARLHLDYVAVRPGSSTVLEARVRSTLSDTRPLFAVFAPKHSGALAWLDRLLDLHPIDAAGDLAAGKEYVEVDHLAVNSGRATVRASLRMSGGRSTGILFAAYGPLSVGIEMRGGERHWKFVGARRWFESAQTTAGGTGK